MLINKFLQLFSKDYLNNNIDNLVEFTKKTLPSDGTDNIFIGCILIMYDNGFVDYGASGDVLLSIVKSSTKKIGINSNLLFFYVERVNRNKLVSKYLKNIINDPNFEKHVGLVIEYLEQFKFDFSQKLEKEYSKKIDEYEKKKQLIIQIPICMINIYSSSIATFFMNYLLDNIYNLFQFYSVCLTNHINITNIF